MERETDETSRIEFELDPSAVRREKLRRKQRLHVVEIPLTRLVGFAGLCLVVYLHNRFFLDSFDPQPILIFSSLLVSYCLLSWAILKAFQHRAEVLGELFMGIDVLFMTLAVYVGGAEKSFLFVILFMRVADQAMGGLRRGLFYAAFAVLNYAGMLAVVVLVDGRELQWPLELCKLFFLLVGSLYVVASAHPFDRLRIRNAETVRMARELILRQKETSRQLRQAWNRADAASQAKSEFLANMSHEIRTPMTAIIGLQELLLESELDAEQTLHAETVRDSARSLLVILGDLLDLSKVEAGKLKLERRPTDVCRLMTSVVQLFESETRGRGVELIPLHGPDIPARVMCDPSRLRQILINLVANAVKFTERGRITVEVESIGTSQRPRDAAVTLRFTVADTGIGISDEDQHRLFQPFTQIDSAASRRRGGTGLGLAICQRLVEALGGELRLRSRPGEGSSFFFELSLAVASWKRDEPQRLEESTDSSAALRLLPGQGSRVLVVEDNPVNRTVALHQLRRLGCEVASASDGEEALQLLRDETFDLVMMDCQMPGLDGYEVTRRLRLREGDRRHTPIIALTAHALAEDRGRCLEAGMDDHLVKPARLGELAAVLLRWLPQPATTDPLAREAF